MEQTAHLNALHFDVILSQLKEHALSQRAKDELGSLAPIMSEAVCRLKMQETTSARALLDHFGTPPLGTVDNAAAHLHHAKSGGMLTPAQLCEVVRFISACKRTADYLHRGEEGSAACVHIAVYGRAFADLGELRRRIESSVTEESVYDDATPTLRDIRRRIQHQHSQIREKLDRVLKSKKAYLADNYYSIRGDHYVLPVLRRYRNEFGGTVIEASSKGGTLFMEPTAIRALQEELSTLLVEEDTEVRRILYVLSGDVADAARDMENNAQLMQQLDVIFAKAKFSAALEATEAQITTDRTLVIRKGRHPMLPRESCVPLDIAMDEDNDGVLITGPNTGGKTLTMKTVGLLCAMAQSGLHIPAGEGCIIPMHDRFLCDIGDSQSISQNLSTFSGHLTNVLDILRSASRDSLVLLDELGSGTDPAEGMGIALAVLQELWLRGCRYMVTTHDPKVKDYAANTPRVIAARMAFDQETLQPLYRLEIGKTGNSCALHIAKRLGMPEQLLQNARQIVYGDGSLPEPIKTKSAFPRPASRLERKKAQNEQAVFSFTRGDSVILLPQGEHAIVYQPADDKGNVIVQLKGEKLSVNHKRLKLHIPASQLYPDDYDFSIIFDTVANRKASHLLDRRYDEDAVIIHREATKEE